ncbi:MAG: LolA family protein [Thermochromatium sp.]
MTALYAAGGAFAAEGAQRVDDYLKGLTSLKAEFEQFTFNAERTQMMERRGTLYLQRPGRFRWEYEGPNKQIIIADGKRVYVHDIELKQVSHQSQTKALRGTPALLLSNAEPIEQHFEVRPIESSDGRDWVELIPKDPETDVVRIELGFSSDALDSLIVADRFGQETRINFMDVQRNMALDPGLFKLDQRAVDDFLSLD